jgi:hypothetical protein
MGFDFMKVVRLLRRRTLEEDSRRGRLPEICANEGKVSRTEWAEGFKFLVQVHDSLADQAIGWTRSIVRIVFLVTAVRFVEF